MGGGSGKSSNNKQSTPATPTVATNPNYIPMQQPQAFAPGMKEALAQQLAAGYGQGGLLGTQNYTGLLDGIYSQQALAADPIGVAQQIAAASAPQQSSPVSGRNISTPEDRGNYTGRHR